MNVETCVGDRVTLRAWTLGDADWYVSARDDAVFTFTTERKDLTTSEVVEAIERAHVSGTTAAFAIEDEQGQLVGNVAVEFTDSTAEISYFIAPEGRGRGLATDAVRTALRWLRSRYVAEVRAVTANGNAASATVLSRIGFHRVGDVEHERLGPSHLWEFSLSQASP